MKYKIENFFTSGHKFEDAELDLASRYQMINIALVLSSLAFIYGIIINTINDISGFVPLESFLLLMNGVMFFILRRDKKSFELVANIITIQCTFLLLKIIYTSSPEQMKHTWLYTYPIVLLYFQKKYYGLYWFIFLLLMILIAPIQNFVVVQYSLFQVIYISVVLLIVGTIVYFYKLKMNEAKDLIVQQQKKLLTFNAELAKQVREKTLELQQLNESLAVKVESKAIELMQKDKLITAQSKQAVMGEMITMIAHQWRQPLSTITLKIANYQFSQLLHTGKKVREVDKTLSEISDTIIYLSDTIDDFQTYFHPNKELHEIELKDVFQKAVNFVLPRSKEKNIDIIIEKENKILLTIYINELIQVLLNLINNSIDALKISHQKKPRITLYAQENNERVQIFVKDNADGISDANVSRIFEPYFSTKGKNGTGLGLYMSQMIVQKQFHGDISVESSPDGSLFIIDILKKVS